MIWIAKDSFSREESIKKSRFICQLKRVSSEAEAREFILAVKKEQRHANHNCFAFILGDDQKIERSSDDGEPTGTAGVPMLEVLKKREVSNVCAVVTRYFGGIKLGASGLIRAYAGSVSHALDDCGLVELVEQQEIRLSLDYSFFDSLNHWLGEKNLSLAETSFTDKVAASLFVNVDESVQFLSELTDHFSGKIVASKGKTRLVEIKIS